MFEEFEPIIEEVKNLDSGRVEPRVRWKGGYALIALGEPGILFDLPGRPRVVGANELLDQRDVLVLGERSGGLRDFLAWFRTALEQKDLPYLFVDIGHWTRDLVLPSERTKTMQKECDLEGRPGPLDVVEALGKKVDAAEKASKLATWGRSLPTRFYLVIRDFSGIEDKPAETAAHAIRMIRDSHLCPNLHLVIGSSSEDAFLDRPDWSGYLPLLHLYRLPYFGVKAVSQLADWHLRTHKARLTQRAVEEIIDVTGGQPLLVQTFLGKLKEGLRKGAVFTENEVRRTYRSLRTSPPEVVQFWRRDLQRILKDKIYLVDPMCSYTAGTTLGPVRMPPPLEERSLMVAGWVRVNRFERWGISSDLHAILARPVLDGFRKEQRDR